MIGNRFETYDPTFEVPDEPVYRCGGYDYALYLRELKIRDINSISPILFPLAGIILVYDLSSPHSWDKAVRLKNIIRDSQSVQDGDKDKTRPSDIQVMMLGLKADIRGGHWVSRQEREEFAHQHGSLFAECSSCTGEGVHEAIGAFVEHMHGTVTRQPELVAEGSKRISNAALAEAAKQVISTLWTQSSALLGVYQQWRWLDLVKERKLPSKELDLRGGTMCIALWGSPGEDDCLRDMVRTKSTVPRAIPLTRISCCLTIYMVSMESWFQSQQLYSKTYRQVLSARATNTPLTSSCLSLHI